MSHLEDPPLRQNVATGPAGRIEVVNHHHLSGNLDGTVYIGRPGKGESGSPLANPRRKTPSGGGASTLEKYEEELRRALDRNVEVPNWGEGSGGEPIPMPPGLRQRIRAEMNRLYAIAATGKMVYLRCFCAPRPCHGDVIKAILEEALAQGPSPPPDPPRSPE